jgi:hypothetical protein
MHGINYVKEMIFGFCDISRKGATDRKEIISRKGAKGLFM